MKNVIYKISNNVNDKIYIGSSVKFSIRCNQHKFHLLKNSHFNKKLQNHVNKYGFDSLVFEIIESDCKNLIDREQFYIDLLNPFFNIRKIAESNFGLKRTNEQKVFMVKQRNLRNGYKKGWTHSKETIDKIKKTRLMNGGYNISDEQKLKISNSSKGRIVSEETRKKISKSTTGKIVSVDTKEKLSEQKIGNKNPMFGKCGISHHNFGKKYKQCNPKKSKKVIDTNTNTIYQNAKIASDKLNIPFSTFYKYLLGYSKKITNFKYYED